MAVGMICHAQQVPNGDFETWNTVSCDNLNGWFSSNNNALDDGLPANVTKYTPAHTGSYSMKLETEITTKDTVFGYIANSQNPFSGQGGVPYTQKPDSFYCYAKVNVLPGDTGLLIIVFKKSGSPIGQNVFKIAGNSNPNTWQKLGFKLATMSTTPDSVILGATSSNAMTNHGLQNGSSITYDDFSFNTSQSVPNGGFENWTGLNIEYPATFIDPNIDFVFNGMSAPVTKTTDAYKGNYAVKLKTQAGGPNWIFCGFNDGNWDNVNFHYTGGFPYTHQKDTLIGWYKFSPKNPGGMCGISIDLLKADATISEISTQLSTHSTYTEFQIPFDVGVVPDSAVITINSSQTPVNLADTGSVLIVDEIQFKSAPLHTGIQTFTSGTNVLVCPNPTSGEFNFIYCPKNTNTASYIILDENGKLIASQKLNNLKTTVDLTGHAKGIYFLKITDGNNIISKKITLQ